MEGEEESVLVRKSRLTHVEVERKVEYYYCNEAELGSLKSTGFIQNVTMSVGTGALFFGVPLLCGLSSIQLDGSSNLAATNLVGWMSVFTSAVFFLLTYLLDRQGNSLIRNLKSGGSHQKTV